MPSARRSAIVWVNARTRTSSEPSDSGGGGTGPSTRPRGCSPSYQSDTVNSGAPVRRASSAGPAGIRVRPPKNVTSTPRVDRSRSASSGTTLDSATRSARMSIGGRSPPDSGMISIPSDSR
jgi:hypothetical protein